MYKEENPQIAKGQLIGALIGLARATDGNVNRPTEETDRAFLKGMQMCFPHWEESCQQIHDQIEVIHEEKWKLVPRCLECASPCGRNKWNEKCAIEIRASLRFAFYGFFVNF